MASTPESSTTSGEPSQLDAPVTPPPVQTRQGVPPVPLSSYPPPAQSYHPPAQSYPPPAQSYAPPGAAPRTQIQPRSGTAPLGWIAFCLCFVAPIAAVLDRIGAGTQLLALPAAPSLIATTVLAILALKRRLAPRWPAVAALVVVGIWVLAWAVMATWVVLGIVQIAVLSSH